MNMDKVLYKMFISLFVQMSEVWFVTENTSLSLQGELTVHQILNNTVYSYLITLINTVNFTVSYYYYY